MVFDFVRMGSSRRAKRKHSGMGARHGGGKAARRKKSAVEAKEIFKEQGMELDVNRAIRYVKHGDAEASLDGMDDVPVDMANPFGEHAARGAAEISKLTKMEVTIYGRLVHRHGDDYAAMARDLKLNPQQLTAARLRKKCISLVTHHKAEAEQRIVEVGAEPTAPLPAAGPTHY